MPCFYIWFYNNRRVILESGNWVIVVDWSGGGSTSPGKERAEDPRSCCRRAQEKRSLRNGNQYQL